MHVLSPYTLHMSIKISVDTCQYRYHKYWHRYEYHWYWYTLYGILPEEVGRALSAAKNIFIKFGTSY